MIAEPEEEGEVLLPRLLEHELAQRLLAAHGSLHADDVDGSYGPVTAHAVHAAKWRLGYKKKLVDSTFGPILYAYLSGAKRTSAMMRVRANARKRARGTETRHRAAVVKWCRWGIANTRSIFYSQGMLRMAGIGHPGKLPLHTDCSASTTVFFNWAGAPDPNGLSYNHTGYTGSIGAHCKTISRSQARGGDLVLFGAAPYSHVCVVLEGGEDPLLCSHGQDDGPIGIRFAREWRAHGNGPVRWVTLPKW